MSGGTFTISSLGGIGGTQFTPIVNAPEVAIMGLSKAKMQPVWNGSEFIPRLVMPFSVSYDHRALDGAEGVRFTTTVGKYLSDLRQLIL
jgi:pyruvate dehydrogenase E2 component (dihydrolipoamide acetyltransferase)|nr:2-oxo acid dehydrogenase subunit E2 [Thiomicrorhabdus sp.]